MYQAIITPISSLSPIQGADKIQLAEVAGHQIIVGRDVQVGQLGCFFPADGQLSHEFCMAEKLYRKNPETGELWSGYFESNRRVRSVRIRKVFSEGFWVPVSKLAWTDFDVACLKAGLQFTELNGKLVCSKYVTPRTREAQANLTKKARLARIDTSALKEHKETGQLRYEIGRIKPSLLIISEKCHGTSGRTGRVLVSKLLTGFQAFWNRWAGTFGLPAYPTTEYRYCSGSRHVNFQPDFQDSSGFRHTEEMRVQVHDAIVARGLRQGETLFYEIVGFEESGKAIMGQHGFDPRTDQDLIKLYDQSFRYSYGCQPDRDCGRTNQLGLQFRVLVYRITLQDGEDSSQELSWEQVVARCSELNLETVPELYRITYSGNQADLAAATRQLADGPSTLDARHPREGVVVRVESGGESYALKRKGEVFCMLEGLKKNDDDYLDPEEAQ